MISEHAEKRMNQRAFRKMDVDLIYYLGEVEYAPGGVDRITISSKKVRDYRRTLDMISRGATLIADGRNILTMYKRHEKKAKKRQSNKGAI